MRASSAAATKRDVAQRAAGGSNHEDQDQDQGGDRISSRRAHRPGGELIAMKIKTSIKAGRLDPYKN
jgi:hypothetical protein